MQRIEAIDEYNRAQRSGMRDYREKTAAGKYPYLPALDELLEKTADRFVPVPWTYRCR